MNFIFEKTNTDFQIAVVEITDTLEELLSKIKGNLSIKEIEVYNQFKNNKRKVEWLGVRLTLKKMLGEYTEIKYTKNRNPYIDLKHYISITHSNGLVGIIISNKKEIGIDIEILSPKILRTAHKFITDKELKLFKEEDKIKKTYLNWCCKETLFKIKEHGGFDFKDNFRIIDSELKKSGKKKAIISYNNIEEHFCLYYEFINFNKNELLLVWH